MTKYTVTFTDYNDVEHTEDLYFHLSEEELLQIAKNDPDFSPAKLDALRKSEDPIAMFLMVRKVVGLAFGVKSEDGWYFDKKCQKATNFLNSAACEKFLDDLISSEDPNVLVKFFEQVFPKSFMEKLKKAQAEGLITG